MENEPQYSEREVAQIIERAIRSEKKEANQAPSHGLTLRELERIGEEVGIAPERLRAAAAEIRLSRMSSTEEIDAKAKQVRAVRWVPGRLSDEAIEDMFAEIKSHRGPEATWGRPSTDSPIKLGRTYEWTHGSTRVTVTDHGDGYIVQAFASQFFSGSTAESVIVSLWLALAVGGLLGGAVGEAQGVIWAILIVAVACAISFALVPRSISRKREQSAQSVEALADEAASLLNTSAMTASGDLFGGAQRSEEKGAFEYPPTPDPVREYNTKTAN